MQLLILEDDLLLAQTLQEELEEVGYSCALASSIESASELSFSDKFDLYLFDVNVPDGSGFELLAELRASGDITPTIFLTSKSQAYDVGKGFDVGANDYVKKPFEMEELLFRIKRFIKEDESIAIAKDLIFYPATSTILIENKKHILQKREADILHYFLKHQKQIVSKDEIINNIFDGNYFSDTTFRVYITNIKKIIGHDYINNRRGAGYIFESI